MQNWQVLGSTYFEASTHLSRTQCATQLNMLHVHKDHVIPPLGFFLFDAPTYSQALSFIVQFQSSTIKKMYHVIEHDLVTSLLFSKQELPHVNNFSVHAWK